MQGIYIMVDVVANHMGQGPISDNRPVPLNQQSSYHTPCTIDYSNQTSVENCEIANLPDVDTQDPNIRSLYQNWIKSLVGNYSFDGVRIDTVCNVWHGRYVCFTYQQQVKHVEKAFWSPFSAAAGVYCIGEVFDGSPSYVAGYANTMPGLLNYPVYYPLNNFYQQKGSSQSLVDMINTVSSSFPDPAALGTFIDNHDNPRWLNQKNDQTLLRNALAFVILSRGIPIVYYGTEQGYSGGADPANREDLWRSNFNTQTNLYQAIAKLNSARKAAGGLAGNDHVHLYVADQAYAWSRANGNLVVLTTNGGGSYNAQHCFNTQKANGKWTNTYGGGSTVTADSNGQICLQVTNGEPIVLVAGTATSVSATPTSAALTTLQTATSTACPTAVSVTFTHKVTTVVGDTIRMTGNTTQLGSWTPANGPALSAASYTSSNPIWTIALPLTPGSGIEYKFVKVAKGGAITWESDPNRVYSVPKCQASAAVNSSWQ